MVAEKAGYKHTGTTGAKEYEVHGQGDRLAVRLTRGSESLSGEVL